MLSIFSPNFINDDQSFFSADFAMLFTLSDGSSDGLPAPIFENPNAKSGEAWRLAGTKKPETKTDRFPKENVPFFLFPGMANSVNLFFHVCG